MTLADLAIKGDRLALARLLTQVENNTAEGWRALSRLFPKTGNAHLIGVTGAPGTGKSSLVNRLALHYRRAGATVAIAAVDPSSPFSGGAVLGDRVRMKDLSGDPGVFIRSMASRGALGGLAHSTAAVVQVLDAAGYEIIFIETVGAGQGEVDIARLAHTILVVEAPGMGDDIQAIKAGILEIADILVLNKADLPGADITEKALRSVLDSGQARSTIQLHHGQTMTVSHPDSPGGDAWATPILRTVSVDGQGIPRLAQQIQAHRSYLRNSGRLEARENARVAGQVEAMLQETLLLRFHATLPKRRYNQIMQQVYAKRLSPSDGVALMLDGAGEKAAGREHKLKGKAPGRRRSA